MPNYTTPSITAIVPATDRPATLQRCLDALASSEGPPDEVVVQRLPRLAGPATARNAGARRARGEVLVFVDADVEVHPDAIGKVRQAFRGDTAPDAIFGAYDDRPAAGGVVSRFRNLLHHHVHVTGAGPASTFWAGLGAVRREAFLAEGGFDAGRFPRPSVEDVELGMRMHASGLRIELDPAIRGTHLKAWSLGSMIATDFARRGVPWLRLLLERRGSSAALNLGPRHRLSALATLAALTAILARRPVGAAGITAGLLALNRSFYALLARNGGLRLAGAGVALHCLHHLVSVAAAPVAAAVHARTRLRRRPGIVRATRPGKLSAAGARRQCSEVRP